LVWLTSDQADYINGISLFVDGGMDLYPGFAAGGWTKRLWNILLFPMNDYKDVS
jgi:hypothetical protein